MVHQTLTAEEYAQAAVFAESHRSVWSRRGVRAAAALTVAALAFSCIPVYRYQIAAASIPICRGLFGRAAGGLFFLVPAGADAETRGGGLPKEPLLAAALQNLLLPGQRLL